MQKLISVDFQADFGFFRKPDTNNTINLSYTMLHKPALLGILGAIIGLEGYQEFGELPEYYQKLKDVQIGVQPLNHDKGNFQKTTIKYSNTIGYANKGTNFLTEEVTLIQPAYRVYILLDTTQEAQAKLYTYLQEGKAEYIPYFGKNEFYAWWNRSSFQEYDYEANQQPQESFKVKTLFLKDAVQMVKDQEADAILDIFDLEDEELTFLYFERLPMGFDETLNQYELGEFTYATFQFKENSAIQNLYFLKTHNYYVQLH
ncbi:MAG: type I-B CRISPR-associated protein Cas5b [Thermonemataceae bacterium]